MKLTLIRISYQVNCTIGKLYIDGVDSGMHTLEDACRDEKIAGKTAIPQGFYEIEVTFSPHFKRELPLLLKVPNFEGVRIHPGNTDADTEGCILVGRDWGGGDFIGRSKEAFEELFTRIKAATHVAIEIG